MLNIFRSDDDEPDEPDFTMYYNPDPLVNRMNLVIRLVREMEMTTNEVTYEIMYQCVQTTIQSMKSEEKGVPDGESIH